MMKMKHDAETDFFCGLMKLAYGRKVEPKLRKIAQKISWARGWPKNKRAFWNAEAFMWGHKIEKQKRELIQKELNRLLRGKNSIKTSKNLDLGCGSYSYLPSVGFDISEKMLLLNENLTGRIGGDLEEKLPFADRSFDSATTIFVLNYVKNYPRLLFEIRRVLKPEGKFVAVLSATKINDWQRQKEVNDFPAGKWASALERARFKVNYYKKKGICFFQCTREAKNVKN